MTRSTQLRSVGTKCVAYQCLSFTGSSQPTGALGMSPLSQKLEVFKIAGTHQKPAEETDNHLLVGGSWDFVATYIWVYNLAYAP